MPAGPTDTAEATVQPGRALDTGAADTAGTPVAEQPAGRVPTAAAGRAERAGAAGSAVAHQPAADTAGAAAVAADATVTEESGRTAGARAIARTAVAEQPAAGATVDVLRRARGAVADHQRAEHLVDHAIDRLAEVAVDPVRRTGVQRGVDPLVEQRRPIQPASRRRRRHAVEQ